ncbi:tubby-like protein 4 [Ipomoea triloba]|uniref:tubby-like protein 4 n=1 Tax=Ipomoea triloba TaxID=35885 RepID=UPI00125D4B73|nr:tubby-like protein 4 [Ipomoea triloba]
MYKLGVFCFLRSLLCRPLPVDIGRCTCVIVKETSPDGFNGGTLYSLYTYISKQYELDFRDRGRPDLKIQSSKNGRQTILQLGRVGKAKYICDGL